MKLADIKKQIIQAYFTSEGEGISENLILEQFGDTLLQSIDCKLFNLLNESIDEFKEFDDSTLAYRQINKEDLSVAYVLEESSENEAIYMVVRHGRKFASVNLTSPNKAIRPCTLREVREALLQIAEQSENLIYKVKSIRI